MLAITVRSSGSSPASRPPVAIAGNTTSSTIVKMSSTRDQPTAMRPGVALRIPRSDMPRTMSTVDAVARHMPSTAAPPIGQPNNANMPAPSATTAPLAAIAPGTATFRTAIKSRSEKPRPTPNISSITPTSARSSARSALPTKPGVWGPMSTPANK